MLVSSRVPFLQDTPAIRAALQAYGYQQGKSALSPVGQKVYDAYTGLTNALLSN